MFGILISLASGILMSVQGVFNTQVTKQTGIWIAASFVQATALIVCLAAWYLTGRESSFMEVIQVKPWYILLGGAIGAFITYTVIAAMQKLGPAQAVLFIISAQLIAAWLIELFGLFGTQKAAFDWQKLIGIAVFVCGTVIFKWKDLFAS